MSAAELFKLRQDLAVAEEAARSNEISDSRYYTGGGKKRDDARIAGIKARIAELTADFAETQRVSDMRMRSDGTHF